jgi:hypothetical protein
MVVASAGGILGQTTQFFGKIDGFPPQNDPKTAIFPSQNYRSGSLRYPYVGPERSRTKLPEDWPPTTGSLPVSPPAYCHPPRFFIAGGESVFCYILPVAIVAIQSSRLSFLCRQQMAMSLTTIVFPIATVASRVPPKYIYVRQPGGRYIFSSPIWRRIATNAPTARCLPLWNPLMGPQTDH